MADQHNQNIPAMGNQISADIPDIKENLEFHKDCFERLVQTWSNSDASGLDFSMTPTFNNGSVEVAWPTNNMATGTPKIMVGDSNTVAWFYLNSAPPGWKALATGADTVLGIAATSYTSSGTTTATTADKLVDSGADFSGDGVAVGDPVYNTTDDTYAYVTAVDSGTQLSVSSDIFASGEGYRVGGLCSDGGETVGQWTISNIASSSDGAHTHSFSATTGTESDTEGVSDSNTNKTVANDDHTHSVSGTTGEEAAHSHTITHTAGWRPQASIGKLYQLDTA